MSGTIRVDVTGNGNEFSRVVEVDTEKVVSSIKVDVAGGEVNVFYKRTDDGEPLNVDKGDEPVVEALTGVVAPVNEVATPDQVAELPGDVVSEEEAKAGAHQAGDDGATEGTVTATGVANVDDPTVVVSGGTPTVDGKKPTRSRKTTGS